MPAAKCISCTLKSLVSAEHDTKRKINHIYFNMILNTLRVCRRDLFRCVQGKL